MNADQATFLCQYLTGLLEFEHPGTVKVLRAVRDDRRDFRTDEKSRTVWQLAAHLVTSDLWFLQGILDGEFVWTGKSDDETAAEFSSVDELVALYTREFPARLAKIRALPAEHLMREVKFIGTSPTVQMLGFTNNHSIHHRGQLAALLRAHGSKMPAIYGVSADENLMG